MRQSRGSGASARDDLIQHQPLSARFVSLSTAVTQAGAVRWPSTRSQRTVAVPCLCLDETQEGVTGPWLVLQSGYWRSEIIKQLVEDIRPAG